MLEQRLHVDESETQSATSLVLSVHASVAMVTGPFVGHFADQITSRKLSLLVALGVQLVGTIIIIVSLSGKKSSAQLAKQQLLLTDNSIMLQSQFHLRYLILREKYL